MNKLRATEEEILRFAQDDSASAQRITRAYGTSFVNLHDRPVGARSCRLTNESSPTVGRVILSEAKDLSGD